MEAKIIALTCLLQRATSIIDMVCLMAKATNLPIGNTTMNVSINGVNLGALVLAKTLPPQFTPQSKYYAIKTIMSHVAKWLSDVLSSRSPGFETSAWRT
jgi:hypothetical protein